MEMNYYVDSAEWLCLRFCYLYLACSENLSCEETFLRKGF